MIFNFGLRELARVAPWTSDGRPVLSWFGLTDGWFWVELGGQEIFRITDPVAGEPPYIAYQVCHFWDFLIECLPSVLDPVPADIAACMRDSERFLAAVHKLEASVAHLPFLQRFPTLDAIRFWDFRAIDTGPFQGAPQLRFWREDDVIHAIWRSQPHTVNGAQFWHPVAGELTLPVATFVEEVRAFGHTFIAAMGERLQQLRATGGLPGVAIDLDADERQHAARALSLEQTLRRAPDPEWSEWQSVRGFLRAARERGEL